MSEVPPQFDTSLSAVLTEYLANNSVEEALSAINDNRYSASLKDNCSDLVPIIASYLDENTSKLNPNVYNCCKKIIEVIAEKSNPEDALFELLEQAESAKSDFAFIDILHPLRLCLLRLTERRGRSLEWCLNSIQSYVNSLPVPEHIHLEGKQKILLDADPVVDRITSLYMSLESFYVPFIQHLNNNPTLSESDTVNRRKVIACFILQLMGRPLAFLDLETDKKTKSNSRCVAETLILHLSQLVGNVYIFLPYIEERLVWGKKRSTEGVYEDAIKDVYANEEKTPMLALAVLYYLVISEGIVPTSGVPCVYNPVFIVQTGLCFVTTLLKINQQFVTRKGLLLANSLLNLVDLLPYTILELPNHKELCMSLSTVIIYCEIADDRKLSLDILRNYLFKFDDKGRYLIMKNLVPLLNHSGLIGYCATQYKDMVIQSLKENDNKPSFYFSGKRLYTIVNMFSVLPNGVESDMIELADQIIAALNLMRFLALRDKNNITGIWNYFSDLQNSFLDPLREGLRISRAHYEIKLKDLHAEIKTGISKENIDYKSKVSVTIGGQTLPNLPVSDKQGVINSALNAFDIMESLAIRVNECLEAGPANI